MITALVAQQAIFGGGELPTLRRAEQIMAMPLELERHWTAEKVREELLTETGWPRYELIDGELIVTSPTLAHQRLCAALYHKLYDYLQRESAGTAYMVPSDLELRAGTISQPDVFVTVAAEDRAARGWKDLKHLRLAVEVLSPGTAKYDRGIKRRHYQAAGVEEYWIVDPDAELIERWRPDDDRPEIVREGESMSWFPEGAAAPLTFDPAELLAARTAE